MTDKNIDDEIITLQLRVIEVNTLLTLLGEMPFVKSVNLINLLHQQGSKQIDQIMANKEDEHKE